MNIYKITFKGCAGAIYASYEGNFLRMLINDLKETPRAAYVYLYEGSLDALQNELKFVTITELKARTVADKVALFCIIHKEIKGFVYRAGKEEKANLKLVTVSRDLLEVYFRNTSYPLSASKSMADYVKHYNYVRDIHTNGLPTKVQSRFPDVYDREFERSLEGETLSAYWQHLHRIGWRKVDGSWRSPEILNK